MIRVINLITAVGAILLLALSLWPGYAGGWFLLAALPVIGLLGVGWLVAVSHRLRPPWGQSEPLTARRALFAPVLVCLTYGLLTFYVPRRIAFPLVQSRFESYIPAAPATRTKLDRDVGIYHVDEYAADPRGGVYFRTSAMSDGFGPDTLSYGFAHRPNREGSPFGATRYRVRRLTGDWYWFQASDD